jgi:hypothetical protein
MSTREFVWNTQPSIRHRDGQLDDGNCSRAAACLFDSNGRCSGQTYAARNRFGDEEVANANQIELSSRHIMSTSEARGSSASRRRSS